MTLKYFFFRGSVCLTLERYILTSLSLRSSSSFSCTCFTSLTFSSRDCCWLTSTCSTSEFSTDPQRPLSCKELLKHVCLVPFLSRFSDPSCNLEQSVLAFGRHPLSASTQSFSSVSILSRFATVKWALNERLVFLNRSLRAALIG